MGVAEEKANLPDISEIFYNNEWSEAFIFLTLVCIMYRYKF